MSALQSVLEDARRAVQRSDEAQLPGQQAWTTQMLATRDETMALRDALRALIQHAEEQNERIRRLESSVSLHTAA